MKPRPTNGIVIILPGAPAFIMASPDHYARLGLHRRCTAEQIRDAYRRMARLFHPDLNPGSEESVQQTQDINLAYEVLGDPDRRRAYDDELSAGKRSAGTARRPGSGTSSQNVTQDLSLRIEELLGGAVREVQVNDPANPNGRETYRLVIPPDTAPGTRFRVPRTESPSGGFVLLRVRVLPGFRFKARGSDLRCDLRIKSERAAQGGVEFVAGADGSRHRVTIPRGVARGEVLRIEGGGLPRPRGGRGDLLVRITYQVEVRVVRPSSHR